ncbi:hypothetical protein [Acidovorax sp. SUPP2825]|uniref:hypothetical protein n=1 Tax=Acidovorax sp. SUPP2825 TaxID=2920879 RepID=UPI0024E1752A|nr:hypothetical protein [Acidovorax sp. SUPP2825]
MTRSAFAMVCFGLATLASATERGSPQLISQKEAAAVDAGKIAMVMGVSIDEADGRLRLQRATNELGRSLREKYSARLAGLYREWTPVPRFVVRLKGPEAEPSQDLTVTDEPFHIIFQTGATHALAELRKAQSDHARALAEAFPTLQSTRIDERTGELVISVLPQDANTQAPSRATAITGVPTRVELGDVPRQLALNGGGGFTIGGVNAACTGGFVVIANDTQTGASHNPMFDESE